MTIQENQENEDYYSKHTNIRKFNFKHNQRIVTFSKRFTLNLTNKQPISNIMKSTEIFRGK